MEVEHTDLDKLWLELQTGKRVELRINMGFGVRLEVGVTAQMRVHLS